MAGGAPASNDSDYCSLLVVVLGEATTVAQTRKQNADLVQMHLVQRKKKRLEHECGDVLINREGAWSCAHERDEANGSIAQSDRG